MTMFVIDVAGHKYELPDKTPEDGLRIDDPAIPTSVGGVALSAHSEDDPLVYFDSSMSPVEVRSRMEDAWSKFGMPPDSGITLRDRDEQGSTNETLGTLLVRESLSHLGDLAIAS